MSLADALLEIWSHIWTRLLKVSNFSTVWFRRAHLLSWLGSSGKFALVKVWQTADWDLRLQYLKMNWGWLRLIYECHICFRPRSMVQERTDIWMLMLDRLAVSSFRKTLSERKQVAADFYCAKKLLLRLDSVLVHFVTAVVCWVSVELLGESFHNWQCE